MGSHKDEVIIECSFCGRREDQVEKMISRHDSRVHICNRCVEKYRSSITDG
ncbi:MAG TPA: hypothetical protein DCR03_08310 [Gammaproteobacteria bacterium]|nr:hypothetical protein [Gammaproteobacteria bacterium]